MSISKFENSVVDQFMVNLTNCCNADKRKKAYEKVKHILSKILDPSIIIAPFGSGPLKTYLPESDIDITILFTSHFLRDERLGKECRISSKELIQLKEELEKHSEEHVIEEVTFVNAAVKLIKLYCDGIPIDISFNQVGGICTFNYLESVDGVIGKEHLFKKAILLIKAW